ncbi:MAG: hypothetical protein RSB05_08665 [Clostridiales bacterium]
MVFQKEEDKIKPSVEEKKEKNEELYYEDSNTQKLSPNSIFSKKKTLGGG